MANLKERDHLEKTRHKSGNNIKIDVTEVGCKDVDCIHQAEDRDKWQAVVNTEMNLLVAYGAGNFLTSRGTVTF